jgi:proteasome lid subunit RPN8/RPN11
MTDPGFRVESIRQTDPFRSRAAFDGFQSFDNGKNAVLVEPVTARSLRAAASRARPDETGGLLSGRTLRDAGGDYVLVSGFVEARPGSGKAVAFEISPQETDRLREESSRANPTADVVGWWHSHRRPSSYSPTDLNTQSVWKQPRSVGLLVFAEGDEWARAYMGPEASDLGYSTAARPHRGALARQSVAEHRLSTPSAPGAARPDGNGQAVADAQPDQSAWVIPDPPGKPDWQPTPRQRGLLRLAAMIVFALVLILIVYLVATVHGLSGQISSGQHQLSGQLNTRQLAAQIRSGQRQLAKQIKSAIVTPPAPPSVSWSCVPQSLDVLSCTAAPSTASGTILWKRNGAFLSKTGPSVTFTIPPGHPSSIQAVLKAPSGTIYSGTVQAVSP